MDFEFEELDVDLKIDDIDLRFYEDEDEEDILEYRNDYRPEEEESEQEKEDAAYQTHKMIENPPEIRIDNHQKDQLKDFMKSIEMNNVVSHVDTNTYRSGKTSITKAADYLTGKKPGSFRCPGYAIHKLGQLKNEIIAGNYKGPHDPAMILNSINALEPRLTEYKKRHLM